MSGGLTASQVEALFDPARYTRLCRQFADRGAPMGREVAATRAPAPLANVIEKLHEAFRRGAKTQGSPPTEDAVPVLLISLVASGEITLRRIGD